MAFNIQVTASAQNDIGQTMDFLTEHTPAKVQAWFDGLFEALESLREMPARHALIAEASRLRRPLRALPYASHRIIYEVDEPNQLVSTIRIYHFKRAPLRPEDLT